MFYVLFCPPDWEQLKMSHFRRKCRKGFFSAEKLKVGTSPPKWTNIDFNLLKSHHFHSFIHCFKRSVETLPSDVFDVLTSLFTYLFSFTTLFVLGVDFLLPFLQKRDRKRRRILGAVGSDDSELQPEHEDWAKTSRSMLKLARSQSALTRGWRHTWVTLRLQPLPGREVCMEQPRAGPNTLAAPR